MSHKWTATIVEGVPGIGDYVSKKVRQFVRDDGVTVTYSPAGLAVVTKTAEGLDAVQRDSARWVLTDGDKSEVVRRIITDPQRVQSQSDIPVDPGLFTRLVSPDVDDAVAAFLGWAEMQDDVEDQLAVFREEREEAARVAEANRQLELRRQAEEAEFKLWKEARKVPNQIPGSPISWRFTWIHHYSGHCEGCSYDGHGIEFSAFGQTHDIDSEDRPYGPGEEFEAFKAKTPEEIYGVERLEEARQHFRGVFRQFAAAMAPDKDVEQVLDGMGL